MFNLFTAAKLFEYHLGADNVLLALLTIWSINSWKGISSGQEYHFCFKMKSKFLGQKVITILKGIIGQLYGRIRFSLALFRL